MGGEALQCSYVVLSVGRYLDPALAVRNLNPELPLPIRSPGFFLPAQKSLRGFCALVGQFHPVGQHGVGFFQAQALWRREQLDGDGVTPTFADFRLHLQQRVLGGAIGQFVGFGQRICIGMPLATAQSSISRSKSVIG